MMTSMDESTQTVLEVIRLGSALGDGLLSARYAFDDLILVIAREKILEACRILRDDPALDYRLLLDLCGVDYLKIRTDLRFEVVYHLYSVSRHCRLRLKVPLSAADPVLPSVSSIWEAADWFEREAWDMVGIVFEGHPFLHRILCHHQFEGHALRKDYLINRRHWCDTVWDLEM
jgi:NADH-quinone oxidoreductase subunit C